MATLERWLTARGRSNAFIVAAPKNCGHIREGGLCWEWPLREGPLYRLLSFYMYTHVCPILFLSSFYCTPANVSDPVASNYDCPEGYYCPAGTGLDWKPCPKGTYSNQRNLDRVRLGLGRGKIKWSLLCCYIHDSFPLPMQFQTITRYLQFSTFSIRPVRSQHKNFWSTHILYVVFETKKNVLQKILCNWSRKIVRVSVGIFHKMSFVGCINSIETNSWWC